MNGGKMAKQDEKEKIDRSKENEHTFRTISARPVEMKSNFDYFGKRWYFRLFTPVLVFFIKIIIRFIYAPIMWGFRVKHKKKLRQYKKEGGFVFVSNHIHPFDAFLTGTVLWPKRAYYTMLMSNLGLPFFGKIMRFLGGAPIPTKREHLKDFQAELNEAIQRGAWVGVYPESALKPYCDYIRPFRKGAFRFALDSNVDIIPMIFVLRKPYGLYRLFRRKPLLHLHILDKYEMKDMGNKAETLSYNMEALQQIISDYFEKHQNIKR